jgi:A/G-specific adenine glycosylase
MELGALVCTPRNPQCDLCPVKNQCVALKENRIEDLPNLGKREAATARQFIAFAIERDGRFLIRQRPAGVVNAHLWEFPNVEINGGSFHPERIFKAEFGFAGMKISHLTTVRHSITRYRITLDAFHVKLGRTSFSSSSNKLGSWKSPAQMQGLAFASAYKKVLAKLPDSGT